MWSTTPEQKREEKERLIFRMFAGGASVSEVTDIIIKISIANKDDWREEDIRKEVERCYELHLHDGKNSPRSIKADVESWIASNISNEVCYTDVTCSLLACYSDLKLTTKNEKASCRMAFKRLVEEGKLEPVRNRSGVYRYVNGHMEEMDFMNADTTPFPIKYPLQIHEFVETYKKSLVVIAGEPNSGKTAFMLNLAFANRTLKPLYFSSEMGAAELKIRLQKFPHHLEEWKQIRFIQKSGDFKDVIEPDGLNIIDYLEVAKDFYEIAGLMNEIFNTLRDGVAVIAIQKPPGRDFGVGGHRTLDKARLYLSIEPGQIKIVKGKIWRNENINPNGLFCKFRLAAGAKFIKDSEWKQ